MPFKSEKQRGYLWANEPEVARKFAAEEKRLNNPSHNSPSKGKSPMKKMSPRQQAATNMLAPKIEISFEEGEDEMESEDKGKMKGYGKPCKSGTCGKCSECMGEEMED